MFAQRRLRSAWASAMSDQSSLSAWRNIESSATHWVHAKILIRLGGCPGWSESSLGADHFVGFVTRRFNHRKRFLFEKAHENRVLLTLVNRESSGQLVYLCSLSRAFAVLIWNEPCHKKIVFGVWDQIRLKPASSATQASLRVWKFSIQQV